MRRHTPACDEKMCPPCPRRPAHVVSGPNRGGREGGSCLPFPAVRAKSQSAARAPPRARHRAARLSTAYGEGGARRSFRSPADHPNSYQVQIYHCLSRMHPMRFLHVMEASPQTARLACFRSNATYAPLRSCYAPVTLLFREKTKSAERALVVAASAKGAPKKREVTCFWAVSR